MGMRFRKIVKLAPGVKLNLNAKSVSVTGGLRGAHVTVNSKGQRTLSAGLPGTGLSYRDTRKIGAGKISTPPTTVAPITRTKSILCLIAALVITSPIAIIGGVFVWAFWDTASGGTGYMLALIVTALVLMAYLFAAARLMLFLLGVNPRNLPD
jgi:hypothetical protein